MRTISTGEPSTLSTYLKLARLLLPDSVPFLEDKIASSPNGADEEVIADERQMMVLLASFRKKPEETR